MKELTINAEIENIAEVTSFVNLYLEEHGCPAKVKVQIDVAIDELFGNISHYAYHPGKGKAVVRVGIRNSPPAAVLTFIDSGIPYNPLEREDPDIHLSAEERRPGGLGIYMVKKIMDEMAYEYKDGENIVTITKYF